jgi:transposase
VKEAQTRVSPWLLEGQLLASEAVLSSAADGGFQGTATGSAVLGAAGIPLEIVKRPDSAKGFVFVPKHWIPAFARTSHTFGWLGRCRRLAKDFENRDRPVAAFVILAMIRLTARRSARLRN